MAAPRPDETTTQALARHGYGRASHNHGDETCAQLRSGSGQTVGACLGRHVYRLSDGLPVVVLGCSPPVGVANEWLERGCPGG